MKRESKRRLLAGVLAAQIVLQASAVTAFADDAAAEPVTETTAAAETTAAPTTETTAAPTETTALIETLTDPTESDAAAAETTAETTAPTEQADPTEPADPTETTVAAATEKALLPEPVTDIIEVTGGTNIPSKLVQGKLVNIKGTVTSKESNIKAVSVIIYDQAFRRVTGGAATPNAKTYDLSRLDDYVTFDKLVPGTYFYRVLVTNDAQNQFIAQEVKFEVVSDGTSGGTAVNDTLTITGETVVPDSIKKGAILNVKGTVTSASSPIAYLTVGVYSADGKFVTGKTIAPKVQSYDLRRLDNDVAFDKLAAGTYTFAVIATNAANQNYALISKSFKVEDGSAPSVSTAEDKLTLTGVTSIPDTLKKGAVLSIRGTVTSYRSAMTSVTVGVYDKDAKFVTGKTVDPKAKSYDLQNLDRFVVFNTLPEGEYTFAVIASNAETSNETLVSKKFTIGSAASPSAAADSLTISGGTAVPNNLAVGKSLNVTGVVTSASSDMTALTVGVYSADGKFVTGKTINPKAKTYDLKNLDSYVEFNKLTSGEYMYAVIATNASNSRYTLVSKKFTVGSGSSSTASSDKMTISGGTEVPATLALGKALNVTGVVTSESSNLTSVTVGIYAAGGKFITGKTVNPGAKSYDLKNLDKYVEFNRLTAGSYLYAVIATNSANKNYTLVNKSFTVGNAGTSTNPGNTADGITISNTTSVPDTLPLGKALSIYGTVTSASSSMTALTCGVYSPDGKFVTGKTINPNAKSYDLKKLDAYVAFNTLAAGTYTYAVIASNASNTNVTLVSKKFTVGSGSSNTSTGNDSITISGGTSIASTIAKGKGVIVRGILTSAVSNLTSVTVGVYDQNGKQVTGSTATPNAKTYDVSALDSAIRFDRLDAGTYSYRVIASNSANNGYTVVNQSFTVK